MSRIIGGSTAGAAGARLRQFTNRLEALAGYETMAIRKGEVRNVGGHDIHAQTAFLSSVFEVAA
ncbi:MAG: hypothetical protein JO110_01105 [Acetobacteraceae bacterium]|nr:hypothetical protein [Acetobacteraceae bacterium]